MDDVEIYKCELKNDGGDKKGTLAILRGGLKSERPQSFMDEAVRQYIGSQGHNEFIEITLDNPWVRVVVTGINDLDYKPFNP